jgi:hypothetical protein
MSPADLELLLQRDIDGETSAAEHAALLQRLREEPDLREHHEALVEVRKRLDEIGLVDPPPGLRADILRAVRQSRRREARGWADWLLPLFARGSALAYASTLAVGVVAGVLLTGVLGQGPGAHLDESAMSGTVLPGGAGPSSAILDRVHLAGPGVRVEAVARPVSGLVVADLAVESDHAAELVVETGGSGFAPRGFEAPAGLPAGGAVVEATGLYVAEASPGRYRIVLGPAGPGSGEVRIRLSSATGVAQGSLRAGPAGASGPAAPHPDE